MAERRTALVTGGAGGIGAAIARRLAEDGASVVAADLDLERADAVARDLPAGRAVEVDLRSPASCRDAVATAAGAAGVVDVLVNAAGLVTAHALFEQDWAEWDDVFATNVRGPFCCTLAAAELLIEAGRGGAIVNISSLAGKVGEPELAAYCATKAALNSLTRSAAMAFAGHDIRVNAVCPGLVQTDGSRELTRQLAVIHGETTDAMEARRLERVPLARQGTTDEVADAVAFLASPAAAFVTGETLNLDGGFLAG